MRALVLLLALLFVAAPARADTGTHVADEAVNIRAQPAATAERVGQIAAGRTVSVVGRSADGEWLHVAGADGRPIGYVLARLLRPSTTGAAPAGRTSLFAQAMRGGGTAPERSTSPGEAGGTSLFAQAARSGEIAREQEQQRQMAAERAAAEARRRAEAQEQARRDADSRRAEAAEAERRQEEERRRRAWEDERDSAMASAEAEADRLQRLGQIHAMQRGFQREVEQRQAQLADLQRRQAEERRRQEQQERRAEAERQRREADARITRERQVEQARQDDRSRQQEAQRQAALRAQTEAAARQQADERAREQAARQQQERPQQLARQNQPAATLTPYGQRPAGAVIAPAPAVATAAPPARAAAPAAAPPTTLLRETMSYCWNTSGRDNGWFCDGPGQLLLTAWTLREALGYAGCDNSMGQSHQSSDSRRVPFRDGFIYYCEHARTPTVHWRDVATLHQVPGTLLERRRSYECRESGPLVCTAEAAIRVFGGR